MFVYRMYDTIIYTPIAAFKNLIAPFCSDDRNIPIHYMYTIVILESISHSDPTILLVEERRDQQILEIRYYYACARSRTCKQK